jgi:hypothetical protein
MPKKSEINLAELVQVLDSGITLADILSDLGWVKKERERHRVKAAKKRASQKPPAADPAVPGTTENSA